jgi:hypothetical protein
MISDTEKDYLKSSVLIPDILLDLGYRTDHRGCLYNSPFRDESAPSFAYDQKKESLV